MHLTQLGDAMNKTTCSGVRKQNADWATLLDDPSDGPATETPNSYQLPYSAGATKPNNKSADFYQTKAIKPNATTATATAFNSVLGSALHY